MKNSKTSNFYHDKPLFGIDIGHGSLKVMQIARGAKTPTDRTKPRIIGYGSTTFDKSAQKDGVIVQPEIIAKAAYNLFKNGLVGDITTRRAAIAIPAYRTFTRSVQLPKLKPSELTAAVQLEAEQYISTPLEELYLDYEVTRKTDTSTEVFMVAVPRTIVDSYLDLAGLLGLETVLIEPTLSSSARLLSLDARNNLATFMIDFGSLSSDISIIDTHTLVTGTVQGGGEDFTTCIKKNLDVTFDEANLIKTRYGLGVSKKQKEIVKALEPTLDQIIKEVRRTIRYYEERYGAERPISQVVTLGGGANMPGLSEYLIDRLRIPVRHGEPWHYFNLKNLQAPRDAEKPMYTTVAGLSLANPTKVFEP